MKHTRIISLVLIGSLSAVSFSACSGEKPLPNLEGNNVFSSIEECLANGGAKCKETRDRAALSHLMKAPRYATKGLCEAEGHQLCSSIALAGATVWLPVMMGFLDNGRPVYVQRHYDTSVTDVDADGYEFERPLTADERKTRNVVAGPSIYDRQDDYNRSSPVVIGGWYPPVYQRAYSHSTSLANNLTLGMRASEAKFNPSSTPSARTSGSSARSSAVRVSSRGGFGSSGRGFSVSS